MRRRRHALGVVDVLEADRDAVQRPAGTAAHDRGLGGARRSERAVAVEMEEGVQGAVELGDAVEAGLRQLDRR